jgi:hypothetical protein
MKNPMHSPRNIVTFLNNPEPEPERGSTPPEVREVWLRKRVVPASPYIVPGFHA